jgi:hypothetical protein
MVQLHLVQAGAEPEGVLGDRPDPRRRDGGEQPQRELGGDLRVLGTQRGDAGGAPTLALCIVNRSTPVPVTRMLDTSDMKLKEMETWRERERRGEGLTGLRRQAKSVERQRRETRLHRLEALLSRA